LNTGIAFYNAELLFFAGLCVSQGVPVRIISESISPDFSELILRMDQRKKIGDFMARSRI